MHFYVINDGDLQVPGDRIEGWLYERCFHVITSSWETIIYAIMNHLIHAISGTAHGLDNMHHKRHVRNIHQEQSSFDIAYHS